MAEKVIKLNLVVAYDRNHGIGYRGGLPWPAIQTDLDSMHRRTTATNDKSKQNAVIFGRKTWWSIDEEIRPWPNRYNIVLSTRAAEEFVGADMVCSSLPQVVERLQSPLLSEEIESVYVLGGATVYEEAMRSPYCGKLYITEVLGEFPADTHLPPIDHSLFKPVEDDGVPEGLLEENGVTFRFIVLEKMRRT